MTIQWSLLAPGLLLLLFPADRLLSSATRLRPLESFRTLDDSPRFRPWWWVPVLWLDPLRGLLGTALLIRAFTLAGVPWAVVPKLEYGLVLGVLGMALVAQTLTRRGDEALLAPMGFAAGVVVALTPWPVALISVAMSAAGMLAFRQFHLFFSTAAVMVVVLGFALKGSAMWYLPAAGGLVVPLLLVAMTGKTLELPTRNGSGPAAPTVPLS